MHVEARQRPVRFTVTSAHVASLSRGKVVYARVEVLESRHGPLRLIVLHRLRRLTTGKYILSSGHAPARRSSLR